MDIGGWIAVDRPLAARRVLRRLTERAEALRAAPGLGPSYPAYGGGVHGLSAPPYIILYRVSDEDIFIERIIHGARLPKNIK